MAMSNCKLETGKTTHLQLLVVNDLARFRRNHLFDFPLTCLPRLYAYYSYYFFPLFS